ncbi:MAG: hypothetical protein LBV15_03445, partial [Planctomycetota bacterium]|nr:hypothetical protein [Planctomycetota bacterium]
LAGEYQKRRRLQAREAAFPAGSAADAPRLLVERLDSAGEPAVSRLSFLPAAVAAKREAPPPELFSLLRGAILQARRIAIPPQAGAGVPLRNSGLIRPAVNDENFARLIQPLDSSLWLDRVEAPLAESVFEAARGLRERLSVLPDLPAGRGQPAAGKVGPSIFDNSEGRRFVKAGVRFAGAALILEGRMCPGARLRVAGKLVQADAEGRFRLECRLAGRRTSLPLKASLSGAEARGRIRVEWEKRPAGQAVAGKG